MKEIFSDLRKIGIFFNTAQSTSTLQTPEETLVNVASILKSDYLTLQLVYTWIKTNHTLIHAEALAKQLEVKKIEIIDRAFLAALLVSSNDRRLISITKNIPKCKSSLNSLISKHLRLAAEMGQVNYDQHFLSFGLKINQLAVEDSKKFIPREIMLKQNSFLYCRALFGSNWRADVAALLTFKPLANPTEIASILGCSYETAHRNSNELKEVGWPLCSPPTQH
jgi:hypothetical protein